MNIMIRVDASSGGQVFRNAIGLSALLGVDTKIVDIRANRPKPGLQAQHLVGLNFLAQATNAKVFGQKLGEQKVVFRPGEFLGGNFAIKVGTAGSVCLVLQSVLPVALKKDTNVRVFGGTDVLFAPPANFFVYELFPLLQKMHAGFDLRVISRGYFPKGKGCVAFSSKKAKKLEGINLTQRKELDEIIICSHSGGLPSEVAKRMALAAKKRLEPLGKEIRTVFDIHDSKESVGCGIEVFGVSKNSVISGSVLGKKGEPAEKVAQNAVEKFMQEFDSNAGVDVHASDQIVPFMALAKGKSSFSCRLFSHHLQKSIEVTEDFLGVKFGIQEKNGRFFVSVEGINFFR